jgi:hypothetical protein
MQLTEMTNWRKMTVTAMMLIVAIDVMSAVCPVRAEERFFPDLVFDANKEHNDFIVDWYSKHLKAMKEPSLWKLCEKDRSATVYRLLWLPTFDRPVSVRLVRRSEGAVLYAVLLDGRGGYEPGKIKVNKCMKINGKQWKEFQRLLDKVKKLSENTCSSHMRTGFTSPRPCGAADETSTSYKPVGSVRGS